jgi:endo-1,4-beta-xylanase
MVYPALRALVPATLAISGCFVGLFCQSPAGRSAPKTPPTLASLAAARGFAMGSSGDAKELNDAPYAKLAATEYNAWEPGNSMKMYVLESSPGSFDFSQADKVVSFAQANGLKVTATAPIWDGNPAIDYGGGNPSWLIKGSFTGDQLKSILQSYITTIMRHYRESYPGVVSRWSMVSEATHLCGVFCKGLGKDASGFPAYIALAYQDARAADPSAQLCYDDFGGEGMDGTSDEIYKLVSYLKKKGLIDCVGLEGQWEGDGVKGIPPAADIRANINRLGSLGLSVYFSQVEIGLPVTQGVASPADLAAQANAYSTLLRTCLSTVACKAFFTWGIADEYAFCWKAGMCAPLPFDMNFKPKPAYHALRSALGN